METIAPLPPSAFPTYEAPRTTNIDIYRTIQYDRFRNSFPFIALRNLYRKTRGVGYPLSLRYAFASRSVKVKLTVSRTREDTGQL